MITTLFGFKKNQSHIFTEEGKHISVTHITVDPCVITQIIESGTAHNYQLGIGLTKKVSKPREGQLKKAGIETKPRFFREVSVEALDETLQVGTQVTAGQVFSIGDSVEITGISKGKGFAGGVKRYNFRGGPKTHGQGDRWRAPGSIGSGTTPGRVYKGKKMAGRLGSDTVTIKGLTIVSIDEEKHIVTVSGPIPGAKSGLVRIAKRG